MFAIGDIVNISLNDNQLTGGLPAERAKSRGPQTLELANNRLTGEIPAWLGGIEYLLNLRLNNNMFTGAIPPELSNALNMVTLLVAGNELVGCVPTALLNSRTNDLDQLNLPYCDDAQPGDELCVNGIVISDYRSKPGLVSDCRNLLLAKPALEGNATLNWSENLDMQNWDGFDVSVFTWERVKAINLREFGLTGVFPKQLGELSELFILFLGMNQLSGQIPAELGKLTKLGWLDLASNNLSGQIPTSLTEMTNLISLGLSDNNLSGPVPDGLNNLQRLTGLFLSRNHLTGEIPSELAELPLLGELYLDGNELSGTIPREIGNFPNLSYLKLSNNRLSGSIPSEMNELADTLDVISLSGNDFTGCIPHDLEQIQNDFQSLGLAFCEEAPGVEPRPVRQRSHGSESGYQPWLGFGLRDVAGRASRSRCQSHAQLVNRPVDCRLAGDYRLGVS